MQLSALLKHSLIKSAHYMHNGVIALKQFQPLIMHEATTLGMPVLKCLFLSLIMKMFSLLPTTRKPSEEFSATNRRTGMLDSPMARGICGIKQVQVY